MLLRVATANRRIPARLKTIEQKKPYRLVNNGVQFLPRPLWGLGRVATCWRIADENLPYELVLTAPLMCYSLLCLFNVNVPA